MDTANRVQILDKLSVFHIAQILSGKVCIQQLFFKLRGRQTELLIFGMETDLGEEKL